MSISTPLNCPRARRRTRSTVTEPSKTRIHKRTAETAILTRVETCAPKNDLAK